MIEVVGLGLETSRRRILDDVSFHLEAFSITVLLGPNGSGKSSLLRSVAGLQPFTCGKVLFGKKDVQSLQPLERARHLAWLASDLPSDSPFSVLEVILAALYPQGGRWGDARADDIEKARLLCIELELGLEEPDFLDRDFSTLSQGERQLVHLARVFLQNAPCLFLDEPTSALDLRHKALVRKALLQRKKRGQTILLSLHDFNEAALLTDSVMVLDHGRLAGWGTVRTVLSADLIHRVWKVQGAWTSEGLFKYEENE